ncbi:MAG: hypothetical protein Q8T09_12555 [Candidatus Melainabacteria bacterium]|nr:hypothetical protein [Candidatus Melainabacteria bacterium]
MQKRASQVLVGDLLVQAELVTLSQLADAMPVALKTGVPVGRVLIASGFLTEDHFRQALSLQSLVRDQLITEDVATAALKLIANENLNLNAALKKLGIDSEYFNSANRLGELLLSASAIDETVLETGLSVSYTTGLQLARVLALRGFVKERVAFVALIAQSLLRDHKLSREQAVDCIKKTMTARENGTKLPADNSLISSALTAHKIKPIRLGELLLLSGMVSQKALLSALDKGVSEEVPLGRMLIRMSLLTDVELNQALILQEMVTNGTITPQDASQILTRVKVADISLSKALLQVDKQKTDSADISLESFLSACGFLPGSKPNGATLVYGHFKSKRLSEEQCTLILQMQSNDKKKEDLEKVLKSFNW